MSEISYSGTGTSGRSYSDSREEMHQLAVLLGLESTDDLAKERFKVDRKKLQAMLHLEGVKLHKHIKHFLHDFNQFKLLSSDGIKKCEHINNEKVKNGQTISLDKYNSGDFLNVINVLKISNSIRIHENSNLSKNLDTFFEKSDFIIRTHIKTLNIFNSRIQD